MIEPYRGNQAELEVTIDLTKVVSDTICLTRKQYPWGI
jgi:hypothetical protein